MFSKKQVQKLLKDLKFYEKLIKEEKINSKKLKTIKLTGAEGKLYNAVRAEILIFIDMVSLIPKLGKNVPKEFLQVKKQLDKLIQLTGSKFDLARVIAYNEVLVASMDRKALHIAAEKHMQLAKNLRTKLNEIRKHVGEIEQKTKEKQKQMKNESLNDQLFNEGLLDYIKKGLATVGKAIGKTLLWFLDGWKELIIALRKPAAYIVNKYDMLQRKFDEKLSQAIGAVIKMVAPSLYETLNTFGIFQFAIGAVVRRGVAFVISFLGLGGVATGILFGLGKLREFLAKIDMIGSTAEGVSEVVSGALELVDSDTKNLFVEEG